MSILDLNLKPNGHAQPKCIAFVMAYPDGTFSLVPQMDISPKAMAAMLCNLAAAVVNSIEEPRIIAPPESKIVG